MKDKLKDILSNSNKDIDNQKLMDYISGKLPNDERHEFEKQMNDSDFMNDAVEGLESFSETKNIDDFVEQLNRELHKNLDKKKKRKEKRKLKDQPWILFAIILLLVLIVISFLVLRKQLEENPSPVTPTQQKI